MTATIDASVLRPSANAVFAAYESLVTANREQVERVRELMPPANGDFWADRAPRFRPGELDAPEADTLLELSQPGDTWMDIGAGGGRFAVPLAQAGHRVIAVEPSPAMREVMSNAALEAHTSIEQLTFRWPPPPSLDVPQVDLSLAANVLYDAHDLPEFLDAMERVTRRLCVVILSDRAPSTPDGAVWQALYSEPLRSLPGLREFLAVLGAWGRRFHVRTYPVEEPVEMSLDDAVEDLRWRYWIGRGTELEGRLRTLIAQHYSRPSGLVQPPPRRNYSAVVWWEPGQ